MQATTVTAAASHMLCAPHMYCCVRHAVLLLPPGVVFIGMLTVAAGEGQQC
jgi:hypothetical protein